MGGYRISLDFIICNRLETACILGTDFCDHFVEAILPKRKQVELDNGTTITIIRNQSTPAPQVRVENLEKKRQRRHFIHR